MTASALKQEIAGFAARAAVAPAAEPELFALPCADEGGRIEAAVKRGPGRPKGASNWGTKAWRDYLLARGIMPQQQAMEWMLLGPHGLAVALGCSKLEAFREWRMLAAELGPYFMAKMIPVDDDGKPPASIVVNIGGHTGIATPGGPALPPWLYMQEIQGLGEAESAEPKETETER